MDGHARTHTLFTTSLSILQGNFQTYCCHQLDFLVGNLCLQISRMQHCIFIHPISLSEQHLDHESASQNGAHIVTNSFFASINQPASPL